MEVKWHEYQMRPIKVQAFKWDGTCIPPDAFTVAERQKWGVNIVGKRLAIMTQRGLTFAMEGDWIVKMLGGICLMWPEAFDVVYEEVKGEDDGD